MYDYEALMDSLTESDKKYLKYTNFAKINK